MVRFNPTNSSGVSNYTAAFREKLRTEYRAGSAQTDPTAYTQRIQLGRDIADVLLKNIVRGVRTENGDETVWRKPTPTLLYHLFN